MILHPESRVSPNRSFGTISIEGSSAKVSMPDQRYTASFPESFVKVHAIEIEES